MEGDPNVGSSSSSAIKKRKKTSKVWDEMREYRDTDGNVKAECKHCKKSFDGSSKNGTTHLMNHLKSCRANPKRKEPGGRDGDDQNQSLSPSIKTKELASLIKENSFYGLIQHLSNTEGDTSDEECEGLDTSVLNSRKDEILQLYQEEKEKLCQFLNNLSCRFTLILDYGDIHKDDRCLLVVYYIDDNWERQSKMISFWEDPPDFKDFIEAVKQSCLDWKIDRKLCSLLLYYDSLPADDQDNQIGKMESWFSQQRSLPFAGCLLHTNPFVDCIMDTMISKDYISGGIQSLKKCADYVYDKSISDEQIRLDSAVEDAISDLKRGPSRLRGFLRYFRSAVRLKEVFFVLAQLDSDFRSINLTKQKWDEVTATFEHLKFLKDVAAGLSSGKCDIPIIVDLPYVHKILKDRCNHPIEGCLFCENVMKGAIDLFFGKYNLVRVIAIILDPQFKMDGVQLRCEEIYGSDADRYFEKLVKDFRDVYDAYVAADSSNSETYEMLDAMGRPCTSSSPKSELDLYMKELKVPAVEEFDILAWWRGNAPFYPTLARMARDYLAIPCSIDLVDEVHELLNGYCCADIIDFGVLPEIMTPLAYLKVFLSDAESGYDW